MKGVNRVMDGPLFYCRRSHQMNIPILLIALLLVAVAARDVLNARACVGGIDRASGKPCCRSDSCWSAVLLFLAAGYLVTSRGQIPSRHLMAGVAA